MKRTSSTKKSATDWDRVGALTDADIDTSDTPPLTPEMFAKGVVRYGLKPVTKKQLLTLRVDADVLAWFKGRGRGYQTQINELLRAYMQAHITQSSR